MQIRVEHIEAVEVEGRSRVQAVIDGAPVWFESSDVRLQPRAEVFGCAMLIPALHAGSALTFTDPLDARWLDNLRQILAVAASWWGYPETLPAAPIAAPTEAIEERRTGLCFSGGVDSFYSLLRPPERIDDLVTVFGFDIALKDTVRIASVEESVREIAAQTGKRAIFIRTNLREHPLLGGVSWEISHGGAMAALGHLLSDAIGRLVISSSIPVIMDKPWGSHWRLDEHWSSTTMQIVHFGNHIRRLDKLREIITEPLVRRYLRVCWENRTATGNCSRCAKCLRTRLVLADWGELHHYAVFQGIETLAADLRAVPRMDGRLQVIQEVIRTRRLPPEILHEVQALMDRSRRSAVSAARPTRWSRIRAWISQRS